MTDLRKPRLQQSGFMPTYLGEFDPANLPSCQCWFDTTSQQSMGQKVGGGLFATREADPVSYWRDRSKWRRHASLVAGATPVLRLNRLNGIPGIQWAGSRMNTPSFLNLPAGSSKTVIALYHPTTNGTPIVVGIDTFTFYIYTGTSGGPNASVTHVPTVQDGMTSGSVISGIGGGNVGGNPTLVAHSTFPGGRRTITSTLNGYGGYITGPVTATATGLNGHVSIGDFSTGGFGFTGYTYAVGIFTPALSPAEEGQVTQWLLSKYKHAKLPRLVYCDGNSLTQGTGASATNKAYPYQMLSTYLSTDFAVCCAGNPGISDTGNAQYISRIMDKLFVHGYPKSTYMYWGITNELAGAPTNQARNSQVGICKLARACGAKVSVATIVPRGAALGSGFEILRTAENTWTRANYQDFADVVDDIGGDAIMGVDGVQNDLTYYNADATHLTDAGYLIKSRTGSEALLRI